MLNTVLNFIKKYLSLLRRDFWVFALLALPGMVFYFTGLSLLGAGDAVTYTLGALNKFALEFCIVAIMFCALHVLGLKSRKIFALAFMAYYITITADIVLLSYFRERFGAKYIDTLAGGQYAFMLDLRFILLMLTLYFYPYFIIRKFWTHRPSRRASAKKTAVAAVLLLALAALAPMHFYRTANGFYAQRLMPAAPAQIVMDLTTKKYPYQRLRALPQNLQAAADEYALFTPPAAPNKHTYDRIILLTAEAMSNKFLRAFNPAISAQASNVLDALATTQPYASLRPGALSTLYGLSVIFSGHPNAEFMYKDGFPLSFVKILQGDGWRTAFIRGADEEYMHEDKIFAAAGFGEIYGARHFAREPKYSAHVAWWGLTDRKLFEFATAYLSEHRDEKVFINLLTVDTHVPSGRADYLEQDYPPVEGGGKVYRRANMARAFSNFNYDLKLFIENLQKEALLDERTLLIITGDHPFFANVDTGDLFKNYRPVFDEVPFILLSARPPAEAVDGDFFLSQQDIAPTILGLAGYSAPRGMFGRSIFMPGPRTLFYMKDNYVVVSNQKGSRVVPFTSKNQQDKDLLQLLNTVLQ